MRVKHLHRYITTEQEAKIAMAATIKREDLLPTSKYYTYNQYVLCLYLSDYPKPQYRGG